MLVGLDLESEGLQSIWHNGNGAHAFQAGPVFVFRSAESEIPSYGFETMTRRW